MAIYNIPPAGQVSDEVEALRTKRTEFAHARSQLMYTLQDQLALAEATRELLSVVQVLLSSDYVVPTTINFCSSKEQQAPETLSGTLPPFVMAHADKLQALANAYGYQICMHPKLTDHGRLYPHWSDDPLGLDEVQQA